MIYYTNSINKGEQIMSPYEERKYHKPKCKSCEDIIKPCKKPNPSINCEKVLEEYHSLIKEAEALFAKADELIYKEAFEYIWNALKALENAMELVGKGIEETEKAEIMLDKSGCSSKCNKNSKKCREIRAEADKLYELEIKKIVTAMRLIEKVIFEIKDAEEYGKKAYQMEEEYKKCVHEPKKEKPCYDKPKTHYNKGYYKR